MAESLCLGCGESFKRQGHVPGQKFCHQPECQRERKRLWQKEKLRNDDAYRANQESAQEKWAGKNPDYWKKYRAAHPGYTACNRQRQMKRNRRQAEKLQKSDCKNGRVNPGTP